MSYGNGGEQYNPVNTFISGGGGALGSAPLTPIGDKQVIGHELERNQKTADVLHQVIDQLAQRLEPILSPAAPSGNGTGGTTPPTNSQMATLLRAQGYRIEAAMQRLNELMLRIEL